MLKCAECGKDHENLKYCSHECAKKNVSTPGRYLTYSQHHVNERHGLVKKMLKGDELAKVRLRLFDYPHRLKRVLKPGKYATVEEALENMVSI